MNLSLRGEDPVSGDHDYMNDIIKFHEQSLAKLFDHMDNRTGPRGKRGEVVPFEFVQVIYL